MAPTSPRPEMGDRRGSSSSIKGVFSAMGRRFSMPRRESYERRASATAAAAAGGEPTSPNLDTTTGAGAGSSSHHVDTLGPVPPSPSEGTQTDRSSIASSWNRQPIHKLNSSSPASELPKTWAEWNTMYAKGLIDFNDPPPPPDSLQGSGFSTASGQYRAPTPLNERQRQRAVDVIGLLNHSRPPKREGEPPKPLTASSTNGNGHSAHPTIQEEDEEEEENVNDSKGASNGSGNGIGNDENVAPLRHSDPLAGPFPRELNDLHPALRKLAFDAQQRFGTSGSTVSLMDGDKQVFLADEAFGGSDAFERDSTVCSHSQLKGSLGYRDPLVVMNLGEDWRFKRNNFGDYAGGFYAAAPIMLPAPMGDDEETSYAAGLFCIIDPKPRTEFSEQDRLQLEEMADLASAEIVRYNQEKKVEQKKVLSTIKREQWKRSKLVRRVSEKSSLDTVAEVNTPPQSPALVQLEDGVQSLHVGPTATPATATMTSPGRTPTSPAKAASPAVAVTHAAPPSAPAAGDLEENEADVEHDDDDAAATTKRRDSDDFSETGSQELGTTERDPTYRRKKGRPGVHAGPQRLSDEMKSVLDLSTQLVGESLDLDFCYVVAVDLPTSSGTSPRTASDKPIRLLSGHNIPMPAPLFDIDLHLETLTSHHNALLFTNPDFSGADGEFSCGLLVKICIAEGKGYILAGYSENPRRVLSDTDYGFMKSFARDLSKWVARI